MQPTTKIYRLRGVVQHYNWGGHRFLPELLHQQNTTDQPFAEFWMGAHGKAPSQIVLQDGSQQPLNAFIRQYGKEVLGEMVNRQFGKLPYLFKILDVKDMLSIQVHPTKKAGSIEFDKENKAGIPIESPKRNYKDDNHKPELMYAWSDFWLLHGFKSRGKLDQVLNEVPELNFLVSVWKKSGYEGIYKQVMEMDQGEVNKKLQPLIERILPLYNNNILKKSSEDFWTARAYQTFCKSGIIDRGLFSIYFLNLVNLEPGEAIFQDAGILHAYLEGQNLEIMANSDNVLRGGLTNKHIDVPELLKHVRFKPLDPNVIKGIAINNSKEESFITTANDFELRRIGLDPVSGIDLYCSTADIFLLMKGNVEAKAGEVKISLHTGECILAIKEATVHFLAGPEGAVIFRATVPFAKPE